MNDLKGDDIWTRPVWGAADEDQLLAPITVDVAGANLREIGGQDDGLKEQDGDLLRSRSGVRGVAGTT